MSLFPGIRLVGIAAALSALLGSPYCAAATYISVPTSAVLSLAFEEDDDTDEDEADDFEEDDDTDEDEADDAGEDEADDEEAAADDGADDAQDDAAEETAPDDATTEVAAVGSTEVTVTDGQVRVPMPGRTVTTGYFVIHNHSATPISLVKVETSSFERAELHQHSNQDGAMRMEKVAQIAIAANGSVTLQPGGLHLVLFNPVRSFLAGESVNISLGFSNGEELALSMPLTEMPRR
jgi:periplasmic copper chaperone A